MSRSNNTEISNPSTRWFRWSGAEGKLSYYDKVSKENINVPLPFTFLLLDELNTITGYNESEGEGFYSNEVRDLKKETLNVRCGKHTVEMGLYDAIKDAIKAKGAKYAKSCYIAYFNEKKEMCIGNILMTGSSLAGGKHKIDKKTEEEIDGWMEFRNKNKDSYDKAIVMTCNPKVCTKGSNTYHVPEFTLKDVSPESDQIAKDLDIVLQGYLSQYFKVSQTAQSTTQAVANDAPHQVDKDVNNKPDIDNGWPPADEVLDDLPF